MRCASTTSQTLNVNLNHLIPTFVKNNPVASLYYILNKIRSLKSFNLGFQRHWYSFSHMVSETSSFKSPGNFQYAKIKVAKSRRPASNCNPCIAGEFGGHCSVYRAKVSRCRSLRAFTLLELEQMLESMDTEGNGWYIWIGSKTAFFAGWIQRVLLFGNITPCHRTACPVRTLIVFDSLTPLDFYYFGYEW